MNIENTQSQMRKGILEFCIFSIIRRGEAYPSDIVEEMRAANLQIFEGTLYPLLTRLKNADMLTYRWVESNSGPPRKYFSLTEKGEQFLGHYQLDMPPLDDCMQALNEQSARFLELVSTVLYFEGLEKEEVKEKVFTLKAKQRYTDEEVEEAYQYIDSLRNLVKH